MRQRGWPEWGASPGRTPAVRRRVAILLVGLVAIATIAGVVAAATTVIGFEEVDRGVEITTEYESQGVVFPPQPNQTTGAIVVHCSTASNDCPAAAAGDQVVRTPLWGDIIREPLVALFDEPQGSARLFVREAIGREGPQVAILEARDSAGDVVDLDRVTFEPRTGWHRLSVSTTDPRMTRLNLTLWNAEEREAGGRPHNRFLADELVIERTDPPLLPFDPWIVGGVAVLTVGGLYVARKGLEGLRDGDDDTDEDANRPPHPKLTRTPEEPTAGRPVALDGTPSFDPDPDDAVVRYEWTVEGEPKTGRRVVHTFEEAGEYDVILTVSDDRGATETATHTVTVEEGDGDLELASARPDAPGDDHENLAEETLTFENVGERPLDIGGWTVHDAAEAEDRVETGEHTFEFSADLELEAGATVTLHTGPEPEDETAPGDAAADRHCYWGKDWAVWNNDGDVVVVEDARGDPVYAVRYRRTEAGDYEIEEIPPERLSGLFSARNR